MTDHPHTFTTSAQERFLALLAVGWSIGACAAEAGVARSTVYRLRDRGRAGGDRQAARFARRFDELVAQREAEKAQAGAKRDAELAAEREHPGEHDRRCFALRALAQGDPFIALEPSMMRLLTPKQREQAIKVSRAHAAELKRSRRRKATA